jgi:ParB family chromosome partitioning protein
MKALPRKPPAEAMAHPLLVPHAALAPDPDQPRKSDIDQSLESLVESIRVRGVIQPILVRPHPDPTARAATPYMIVVGERRWTAAGRAGRDEVPVFLLDHPLSPADLLMLQIEENDGDNRQDLSLFDLANAVSRAFELEGSSQTQFARRHRKSGAWVSYLLALSRAEGPVAEAMREGLLRGQLVARTFQRLTLAQQRELLARARKDGDPISLGAAEKLAGRSERRPQSAPATDREEPEDTASHVTPEAAPPAEPPPGPPPASVLSYRSAATPSPAAATAAGSPARTAAPDGLRSPGAAPPSPQLSLPNAPTPAVRSAAAGLLAAGAPIAAYGDPAARNQSAAGSTARITLELSLAQLQTLVRLLGQEPAATVRALVGQLMTCL